MWKLISSLICVVKKWPSLKMAEEASEMIKVKDVPQVQKGTRYDFGRSEDKVM